MATKKTKQHHAVKKHSGRRKMSGVKGDFYSELGGALVGFVGGRMLSDKVLPNLDDKIKAVGLAAVGIFVVVGLLGWLALLVVHSVPAALHRAFR